MELIHPAVPLIVLELIHVQREAGLVVDPAEATDRAAHVNADVLVLLVALLQHRFHVLARVAAKQLC